MSESLSQFDHEQDFGNDYLIGRQVSQEFNDSAFQSIYGQMQGVQAEQDRSAEPVPDKSRKTTTRTLTNADGQQQKVEGADANLPDVNTLPKFYERRTPEQDQEYAKAQSQSPGLKDPWVDPSMVIPSAAGTSLVMNMTKAGMKLLPSLSRAMASGVISGAAEYPIGMATEVIEDQTPIPPWLFNMTVGVASGLTLERFAEDAIANFVTKSGSKIAKSTTEVVQNLKDGNFEDPVVRAVARGWKKLVEDETGLFLGEKAQTINLVNFRKAKSMADKGVAKEKVRLATGFFQGEDGAWRWEMSDKDYTPNLSVLRMQGQTTLGEMIDHKPLFDAYPELRGLRVKAESMESSTAASFNPDDLIIRINQDLIRSDPDTIKGSVLHEIQHWIQYKEGFATGSNFRRVMDEYPVEFEQELAKIKSRVKFDSLAPWEQASIGSKAELEAAFNTYKRLAGETEARDVTKRWINGEADRIENFPEALKVWNEFEQMASKQMPLFDDIPTYESVEVIADRMKALGFDVNDPNVVEAFFLKKFDSILPKPELIKSAKKLIWSAQEPESMPETEGVLKRILGMESKMQEMESYIPYINAKQYARDLGAAGLPVLQKVTPADLPKEKTAKQMKKSMSSQFGKLHGMGGGAVAGVEYDEDSKTFTFDPEKAVMGMMVGTVIAARIARGKKMKGTGIETPNETGRFMRGNVTDVDPVETVKKHFDQKALEPEWDEVASIDDAITVASNVRTLKPEVSSERIKLRWRANDDGMYGNSKMAHPNSSYENGRNTWDIAGCGREAFASQNGLSQTGACYGGGCYAEVIAKLWGRGSVSGNTAFVPAGNKALKEAIQKDADTIGLEATQAKYPDLVLTRTTFKGKEGQITVKKKVPIAKTATVSTNLQPANGQDIRLGVDTDGSAWLADTKVMDAIVGANPRTVSVYSSCYFDPPAPHPLSQRSIINVTVSGWHQLPETLHRLNWARQARRNGWNVILREVTADPGTFENSVVKHYNRLHDMLLKTDFFIMEQPLHLGDAHGKSAFGLPGCCVGSKKNPHTCDNCEVSEGLGQGFGKYWGINETAQEKMLPMVKQAPKQPTSDMVANEAIRKSDPLKRQMDQALFEPPPTKPPYRFDPKFIDLPFKDKATEEVIANINFKHIVDNQGIQDAIEQVGERIEAVGLGQKSRRGVQTHEMTRNAATKEDTLKLEELLGRKVGTSYNAGEITRARYFLVASAQNLVGLGQKASGINGTLNDKWEFYRALQLHAAVQAQVSGAIAEAGRTLNAMKMLASNEQLMVNQIQETLRHLPGNVKIEDLALSISTMHTPQQVGKMVRKVTHAKSWDMLAEWWINSLLSGPVTHAVNVTSTALTTLAQVPERWVAGQFGKALGHQGEGVADGEAIEMAYGMIEGFKDGLKAAWHVLKTGEAIDPVSKVESSFQKAITAENVQNLLPIKKLAPNLLEEGGMLARAVDLVGTGIRIPTTALQAEDSFFKSVAYRMELRAQSLRMAKQEFPDDLEKQAKRMAEIMNDPEQYAPQIILNAQNFARYATYTNELGKYGSGFQKFASHPLMRFIVPFVRTPTNILKFGLERSPFGIAKVIRAGTPAERELALARVALGSTVMMVAGYMASQGLITGGGPSDKNLQATLRRTGWQPYSVKVGDKYYSYNRLEPLGMTLGLASDFAEITGLAGEEYQANYEEIGDLATAISMSLAKNVTSKTWLKGFSEMIHVLEDPDRYGKTYSEKMIGTVVPSAVATVERAVDPELSAVWDSMDSIKSRLPYFSEQVPVRRDFWGQPISQKVTDNKWLQAMYSSLSPVYISKEKDSPIDKELFRLKVGLPFPKKTQSIHGIAVPLDQWEYDSFIQTMNNVPVVNGKNLKESLTALIETPEYKAKRAEIKEAMIKSVVNAAHEIAVEKFYQTNTTVKTFVDTQLTKKQMNIQ